VRRNDDSLIHSNNIQDPTSFLSSSALSTKEFDANRLLGLLAHTAVGYYINIHQQRILDDDAVLGTVKVKVKEYYSIIIYSTEERKTTFLSSLDCQR
jgi:hypothetical protein